MKNRWMMAGLLGLALSACGGGGDKGAAAPNSGAAPASDSRVTFSMSQSMVTHRYLEGDSLAVMEVEAEAAGLMDASPTFKAKMTGQGLDPRVTVKLTEAKAVFRLRPSMGLPPGTYSGQVTLSACPEAACLTSYAGMPKTLNYSVTVLPRIATQATLISLAAAESSLSSSWPLTILPASPDLVLEVKPDPADESWLKVETLSANTFRVYASAETLRTGLYTSQVKVTTRDGLQSMTVPVTLVVNSGMIVAPVHAMTLNASTTVADTQAKVTVFGAADVRFNWRASTATPWIKLEAASGAAGGDVAWRLDLAAIEALPNGVTHEGLVHVEADGVLSPADIRVMVHKKLPEVDVVAPFSVETNAVQVVRVRGRGFNAIADLEASVRFGAVVPTSVRRLSDTSLQVTLPALSGGTYPVTLHKLEALKPQTRALSVVAPKTFTYAAIPTNTLLQPEFFPPVMHYDPVRQALTMQYETAASQTPHYPDTMLAQYRFNGSSWVLKTRALQGESPGLGVSADGSRLVTQRSINSYTGRISTFDIDSLAPVNQFPVNRPVWASSPFLVTNDNRVIVDIEGGGSKWWYVDLKTGALGSFGLAPGAGASIDSWGWEYEPRGDSITADGEHIVLLPSGSSRYYETALPLMLDASEGLVRYLPLMSVPKYSSMQLNHDGSRMAAGSQLLDGNGQLLGTWDILGSLGTSWKPMATRLSADFSRLFVLAYHVTAMGDSTEPTLSAATPKPRVVVFDLTAPTQAGQFGVLGQVEFGDYPGCRINPWSSNDRCNGAVQMRASPDGRTLFLLGMRNLVVMPIPGALSGR